MFDRSSADDPGAGQSSALENELRTALQERAAGITTATLLRPDPPGLQKFSSRPPVTRWRIVGAVAAVSAVILAVVIGRGVVAPQQVQTATPQVSTASSRVGSDFARLNDRLWGATSIVTAGSSYSVSTWEPTGSRTMTVEFAADGAVVFEDGIRELRGRFTTDDRGLVISETSVRVIGTNENDQYLQESAALDALLWSARSPGYVTVLLVGDQLTLAHGATAIHYRMSGVTPQAAQAAGAATYPVVAAVGGTWRATAVRIRGQNRGVATNTPVTFELASDGSFSSNLLGAVMTGRWWATGAGLVVTGFSQTSRSFTPSLSGEMYAQEVDVVNALSEVGNAISSGTVTLSFAAQGAQLIVTPTTGARIPVTFVQA